MKKGNWQIGKFWGIPLQFHWSFLLLALWILWQGWQPGYGFNTTQLASISLAVGLLFFCVIGHEYGHALMARHFGIATERILLFPLGGGAFLKSLPDDPRQEILIAFAGPMFNILLAGALAVVIWWPGLEHLQLILLHLFNPGGNTFLVASSWWAYALILLFLFNLLLAVFNLLPAYPLDGGRILRVLLKIWLGPRQARRWTAFTGIAFSFGFLWIAYQAHDWIMALGAGFICFVGFFELERSRREARLDPYTVADLARTIDHPLYLTDDTATAKSISRRYGHSHLLVVDEWHQPLGFVHQHQLLQATQPSLLPLLDRQLLLVLPHDPLQKVYKQMLMRELDAALVSDGIRLYGLLDMSALLDLMQRSPKK